MINDQLKIYFFGATLIIGLVLWVVWRRSSKSVGLPLAYVLSLGMIHYIGAAIYLLPWHDSLFAGFVFLGFREYFVGLVAFAVGLCAVDLIERMRNKRKERPSPLLSEKKVAGSGFIEDSKTQNPTFYPTFKRWSKQTGGRTNHASDSRYLPLAYIVLGVLFVGVFIPILHAIPSVGAVAGCGAYLMVVGICLACWRFWIDEHFILLSLCILSTAAFPLFTTLTMGFIGYGTASMLIVLTFVASFYRPRWRVVACSAFLIYFGLSAFVTYMRDRTELREGMQAGEGLTERYNRLVAMFSNFELLDLHNEYHLYWIDNRLNQNWLVGMAVANLESGFIPYAHGKTFIEAVEAMVPRILWPDKPVRAGSPEVVSRFTGLIFNEDTSVGVGQVMEFYINFGRLSLFIGFFCYGFLIRWIDLRAAKNLHRGDWRGFVSWFLPGLSLLQAGGSLVEITSSTVASIILVVVINKFVLPVPFAKAASKLGERKNARAQDPLRKTLPRGIAGSGRQ